MKLLEVGRQDAMGMTKINTHTLQYIAYTCPSADDCSILG